MLASWSFFLLRGWTFKIFRAPRLRSFYQCGHSRKKIYTHSTDSVQPPLSPCPTILLLIHVFVHRSPFPTQPTARSEKSTCNKMPKTDDHNGCIRDVQIQSRNKKKRKKELIRLSGPSPFCRCATEMHKCAAWAS